jgi:hypothetical protein
VVRRKTPITATITTRPRTTRASCRIPITRASAEPVVLARVRDSGGAAPSEVNDTQECGDHDHHERCQAVPVLVERVGSARNLEAKAEEAERYAQNHGEA